MNNPEFKKKYSETIELLDELPESAIEKLEDPTENNKDKDYIGDFGKNLKMSPELIARQERHIENLKKEIENDKNKLSTIEETPLQPPPTTLETTVDPETGEKIFTLNYKGEDPIVFSENDIEDIQAPKAIKGYDNISDVLNSESIIIPSNIESKWLEAYEDNPIGTEFELKQKDRMNQRKYELLRISTLTDIGIDLPPYEQLPLSIDASDQVAKSLRKKLVNLKEGQIYEQLRDLTPREEELLSLSRRIVSKMETYSLIKRTIQEFINEREKEARKKAKKAAQEEAA